MKILASQVDTILRKHFFIAPSSSIYNTVSGLFDYGPLGVSLKSNIIATFRKHLLNTNIYELDPSILTVHEVLKASGHIDKFADLLLHDLVTNETYRADHFLLNELSKLPQNDNIQQIINKIEVLNADEINNIIMQYNLKSPTGNQIGKCKPFNLIFKTSVGAYGRNYSYLRPETAQGQFVNFKKMYELCGEKLPFGTYCIGKVFRNEISPRSSLIRVREFEQAEIEYYVHPVEKNTKMFYELPEIILHLNYEQDSLIKDVKMSLCEAVHQNIVNNQTIGYFIGKTYLFLKECGINSDLIRFRQHRKDEMAHYASDCWDAEISTSYGFIECVGIADRGDYDLKMHHNASNTSMKAQKLLNTPIVETKWTLLPDKRNLAKQLKHNIQEFIDILDNISQEYITNNVILEDSVYYLRVPFNNVSYKVEVQKKSCKIYTEEFFPHVIEPSFGIGRILYALVENSFYQREDDKNRCVLRLNARIAPIKCVISTLYNKDVKAKSIADTIVRDLNEDGTNLKCKLCERNVSIGRKYATYDEMGVPFFITVDNESNNDGKVTIRERDSMKQVRVKINDVSRIVMDMVNGKKKFEDFE